MRPALIVINLINVIAIAIIIALTQQSEAMERCEHEDGSTQNVCVWEYKTPQGESQTLVNHNYGEWTFYPHTQTYITWDSAPTAEMIKEAVK